MDKRLADSIVAAAPNVFLDGFTTAIGDGWYALSLDLAQRLQAVYERQQAAGEIPVLVIRIQEKAGGLRVTGVGVAGEAALIIHEAEARSWNICACCGEPGTLRQHSGLNRTLCAHHYRALAVPKAPPNSPGEG